MAVPMPTATTRWRCGQCGNLTRFDVVRTARVREYLHFTLAGEARVEESEVLTEVVERIHCRWCGSDQSIELVQRVDADEAGADGRDAEPA
ncbi:MAG TPA: hypothetical protein VFZ72_21800 [Jiangellaceae bacterium]